MSFSEQLQQLLTGLKSLGPRRLSILGVVGILLFTTISFSGYYLNRPNHETLYSGLDAEDVTRIGAVLNEAGVSFDISTDGKTIKVPTGRTARARMLLAEKGLPRSDNAGYELFDKMGSLGLTSFMQEVTRIRALEGEIARTIQSLNGVKAARVHLVLPDPGSFRSNRQAPSASVVIRASSGPKLKSAQAIRHLVAGAIPGLSIDRVSVMSTDGTLLASGNDAATAAPRNMVSLEQEVASRLHDNLKMTLAPFLGFENFKASVAARLNTDQRKIKEIVFDPDARVERSTKVVKQVDSAQNKRGSSATTVQQDVPLEESAKSPGENSQENKERREETTNYEINSKEVSTLTNGYLIEKLSIAVVVNSERIAALLKSKNGSKDQETLLKEIRELVSSAVGYDKSRGDTFKITSVDFMTNGSTMEPLAGPGIVAQIMKQGGTLISALTIIIVTLMVIMLGVRPALRLVAGVPDEGSTALPNLQEGNAVENADEAGSAPMIGAVASAAGNQDAAELASPQARLKELVDQDEQQAIMVLKRWSQAPAT
ncbi:MAG: flagellar M-ring protein FliF [Rhodobacteraceae bacterium]|nr:flagellar M-ring protein FliF [Paracoccaceae bacterium]